MTPSRKSKIARLPKSIRDQLNERIEDGASGPELLPWLNTHPEVREVLTEKFAGRPITQQNLSEWRRGGYEDWLKFQATQELVLKLAERSEDLNSDTNLRKISSAYATVTAAKFVNTAEASFEECQDTKQRMECICDIQRNLSRIRRDEDRASHTRLREQRWDYKVTADKHTAEQAAETEERRQMLAWFKLQPELQNLTQKLGGTDQARDLSALQLELEHNLKIGHLDRKSREMSLPGPVGVPNLGGGIQGSNMDLQETSSNSLEPKSVLPNQQSEISDQQSPTPETPDHRPKTQDVPPDAIPLANDCTPEEFASRNEPRSITPTQTRSRCHQPHSSTNRVRPPANPLIQPSINPRSSHFDQAKTAMRQLTPSATSAQTRENQEKPTKTNL